MAAAATTKQGKGPRPGVRVSKAEVLRLKEIFSQYDEDNSGSITLKELQMMFQQNGTDVEMAQDFIDSMDKDGDGTITFYELLKELYPNTLASRLQAMYKLAYPDAQAAKVIKQRKLTTQQLSEIKEIFVLYDTKNDGQIDRQELNDALVNAGYTDQELEDLFVNADRNKDGYLDLEEFIEMFRDCYR